MRDPQARRIAAHLRAAAAAVFLLAVGCAEDKRSCTLAGCASEARFDVGTLAAADASRLAGARVEVCLDSVCEQLVVVDEPAPDSRLIIDVRGFGERTVVVGLSRTDVVTVSMTVETAEPALFVDGDVYTIRIVDADGDALVDRGWSVTYETLQPNGPTCGPTCRRARQLVEL